MKKIDLFGVNTFEIYQNSSELPAVRYKEFQKFLLMDAGIGSDIASVNERFAALFKFLAAKKIDESMREAENLYYTHFSILDQINYTQMALGVLIHSINGQVLTDFSTDKVRAYVDELSGYGLTQYHIDEYVNDVKKNSELN